MPVSKPVRLILLIVVGSLLIPPVPSLPASAGSTMYTSGADLLAGTIANATSSSTGIRLPFNETYRNNWTRMDPWPTGRSNANMVYDQNDGVMVLFGGSVWPNIGNNETWTYNLSTNTWRNMNPSRTLPADSPGYTMVFDSTDGLVVLFETVYGSPQGNTWTYNLSANAWTQMNPFPAPYGRFGASMCFDSKDGVVVLFGGGWGGARNDTWTYNLSANSWTQMAPAVSPCPRSGAGMEYDPISDKVVLFGGWGETGMPFNDTWSYDVTTDTWTNRTPSSSPTARWLENNNMVFDTANGKLSIFGGVGYNWEYLNDTWEYDYATNNWARIDAINTPSIRPYAAIAFDARNGGTVLFGGSGENMLWDETWFYNSTTDNWNKKNIAPSFRYMSNMVYDDVHDVIVLFGGTSWSIFNDTWTYDLARNLWTEKHPAKAPMYATSYDGYLMVFDSANGVAVAYGSYDRYAIACTWTYNLSADSWTYMNPSNSPGARSGQVMAYDSKNEVTVLFGGATPSTLLNDTWMYDCAKNTWTERRPNSSPPLRFGGSMVYDEKDGVMVLFGGYDKDCGLTNETWTYNFTTNSWYNMSPIQSPGLVDGFSLVYDDDTEQVVLFGGYEASRAYPYLNETWTYDYSRNSWMKLAPVSVPFPTNNPGIACDGKSGSLIVFGGGGPSTMWGDTWAYNLTRYTSPGNYTSQPFDTGGAAYFGNLTWKADVPANTSLKFQFRTASSSTALNQTTFSGPDGTNGTYYNSSGQGIAKLNNGTRWMQYRAYLGTSDPAYTPVLKNVTARYNLLHTLNITSPAGGESWNGTQNISWNASDPDGDRLFIDIHVLNGSGDTVIASGIPATNCSWPWDTSSIPNGTYKIEMVARDDNQTIPLCVNRTTADFTVFHPHINVPPAVTLMSPPDDAVLDNSTVNLSWCGTDAEGDALFYRVFLLKASFEAGNLPPAEAQRCETFYEKAGLANGTYYWTVVAFDGKDNGTVPEIRRFSVAVPSPNHLPSIRLVYPADNATVDNSSVALSWNASDEDNDGLTFLLAYSAGPFGSATPVIVTTNKTDHMLTGLADKTTYYWTVTANDGNGNTTSQVRRFNVVLPAANHPPQITSSPLLDATVNITYYYNITATDPDGDGLFFELPVSPTGMALNGSTGRILWRPGQRGNFTVGIRVSDGKGGADEQRFNVTVKDFTVIMPRCTFTSVSNGSTLRKRFTLEGTVIWGTLGVQLVQVSIDGGAWQDASGTASWSLTIDTTKMKNGQHTIAVRAFDGTSYSDEASVHVEVDNPSTAAGGAFPWWLLAVVVVMGAAGGATIMMARRKRAVSPAGESELPPLEKERLREDAGAEKDTAREGDAKTVGPEKEEDELPEELKVPPSKEKPAPAVAAAPAVAMGPAVAPTSMIEAVAVAGARDAAPAAVPPATRTAPEGFAIDDIFLMYIDGRLIVHTTRRIKADMDADIMASMLTAVQAFVKESIGMEKGTELGAMEYGDNKILLQRGKHVVLASVIEGAEPPEFRDEMRHAVSNIEGEFGPVLASWDGLATRLSGARRFLSQLGAYKAAEAVAVEKTRTDISLKGELEFYQGFVRLKVAVKNNMETFINDASFRLVYKDAVLRLDHIEPHYPLKGDEVILGNIEPREKKTVAFYLDPQICTESFLEGILSFKDIRGNLEMQKLPRKIASVVCPIMYTDENVNTAMLKRMASEELDKKDTKVFAIPPALAPDTAFDLAEAAVQHHDIRLVREFTEKDPFIGEAWYFGKAKGRDDKLVVRARVLGDKNMLEFFVASSSTLMLTGMLAELKADLNKELAAQRGAPEMRQVTAPQEVDAVAMVRTLLDKAAEAEHEAGDTEVKG